ncbi:MAG: hypothetical protein ACR2OZ_06200 [Verrucomicrobiales bacterium]
MTLILSVRGRRPWTGRPGVTVTVDNDAFAAGVDRVTMRIPSAGPDHFARLAVSQ